jgi:mono/diheme cytochrome c family protein
MVFYMTLMTAALFIYVSFSEDRMQEFLAPIVKLLTGGFGAAPKILVLVAVPLFAGYQVYDSVVPKVSSPSALRIQHPSSNFPKEFETLTNPQREPKDEEVAKFIEQAKTGNVEFIAQLAPEIEKVKGEPDGVLGAFPTDAMQAFLKELKGGNPSKETAKKALIDKRTMEGRALYEMNCRPCHGDSAGGDGPMADGFRLKPINFTDNGTIETIVEGYTFWRITNGGRGLPNEATPWDSAMPVWKLDIPEEWRYKIMMGEYDLAQKTARQPEKAEGPEKGGKEGEKK